MKNEVKLIETILDDHKAENIVVVDISSRTPFASFAILSIAPSKRTLGALGEILKDELAKAGFEVRATDGNPETGWIVVDAGEVLVHIFVAEKRAEIGLDEMMAKSVIVSKPAIAKAKTIRRVKKTVVSLKEPKVIKSVKKPKAGKAVKTIKTAKPRKTSKK